MHRLNCFSGALCSLASIGACFTSASMASCGWWLPSVLLQAIPEPYGLGRAERYEIIRTVGRGAFGEVLLAWDTQAERPPEISGNLRVVRRGHRQGGERCRGYVALKTVASGVASGGGLSKGLVRELRALQMLQDCVHVVQLLDVYPKGSNAVLVLEYMPSDLAKVLDNSPSPLGEGDCKAFAIMLLRGLTFMHSFGLLHRDIKPSNLLISPGGVLKIADFGQTRTHAEPQARDYSHQVATRWYRAPELLYGTRRYGFAVDVWAAGAVIGEMLAGRPLFQGRSDIDQLHKTLQITGTPTEQSWPGAKDLPDYDKVYFADIPPQEPEIVLQGSSREARDLTWLMLRLDPQNRPSALEALRHRFFLVAPEATPCHLIPIVNEKPRRGDFYLPGGTERGSRGEAYLDEGWSESWNVESEDPRAI